MAQFTDLDTISVIVASLAHDVGHDGFNNGYHNKVSSPLTNLFGSQHVQEFYHSAQTIKILELSEFDFITENFSEKDVRTFKKRIIQSILNTDMALMKDLRTQL